MGNKATYSASSLRSRETSALPATRSSRKHLEGSSEHEFGDSQELVSEKLNEEGQTSPLLSDLKQSVQSGSTTLSLEYHPSTGAAMTTPKKRNVTPAEVDEPRFFQDIYGQENVSPNDHSKPSDEILPWTPAEEQRLREMRDVGETWEEIFKVNYQSRRLLNRVNTC